MNAEILCIGTEILLGDIVNTNGAYLAQQLASLGIDIYHQSVVGDNPQRLAESLKLALSRADIVITTGGLGPTYDDVTKKAVADYFGLCMEMHEPSVRKIEDLFEKRGTKMTPNNLLQAQVPAGSTVFFNDTGFAPGVAVERDGKTVIMLPGPPSEMRPMFQEKVTPFLEKYTHHTIRSRTLYIFGMGESLVEDTLRNLMTSSANPTVAPYAKQGEVQVRVSAKAPDADAAYALIDPVVEQIRRILGDVVYGVDVGNLQTAVVQLLRGKKLTVALAESCTGGKVSAAITDVAGASEVLGCGVCAYSNDIKQKLLGVRPETLASHGAVSAETAREMAAGVRALSGADIGISVTGIAGPGGGTVEKPVGLVYFGVDCGAFQETCYKALSRGHKDERGFIRDMAALHALDLVRKAASKL
jgi:nicotinamide-nucleotide amidase